MKKKSVVIIVSCVLVLIVSILGNKIINKNRVINFQSKFIAYISIETDAIYDKLNGIMSDKEYVDKERDLLSKFKKLEKSAPKELKESYKEFLKAYNYNVTNYGQVDNSKINEQNDKAGIVISKINEINEKYNVDIEKRNNKIDSYIEEINKSK